MGRRKSIRTRGKLQLSKYFQIFDEGESVAVTIEQSLPFNFPKRLQGRTGKVLGKRGKSFIIEIKDQEKPKKFLMEPIHLKKIKQIKSNKEND